MKQFFLQLTSSEQWLYYYGCCLCTENKSQQLLNEIGEPLKTRDVFSVTIGCFFELEISLKRYVFLRIFKKEWFKDLDSAGPLISEDEMKEIEILREEVSHGFK